jgi:hypothetical protein
VWVHARWPFPSSASCPANVVPVRPRIRRDDAVHGAVTVDGRDVGQFWGLDADGAGELYVLAMAPCRSATFRARRENGSGAAVSSWPISTMSRPSLRFAA